MQCPKCGNFETRVIKTVEDIKRDVRKRIRICLHCGFQYQTIEKIDKKSIRHSMK